MGHGERKALMLSRLQELGSDPKRSLGQNFLISDQVIQRILMAVEKTKCDSLVEVGPGLGALTDGLFALGLPLTLIELDQKFASYWRNRAVSENKIVRIHEVDALKLDWDELQLSGKVTFVSNLPYQISSSIVIDRSVLPAGISAMVLMFQKEVAQRIMAKPHSKDYGMLTVIAQCFWKIETVTDAGPKDFFPPPNVASRVLKFEAKEIKTIAPNERESFLSFVKAAFAQRRKLMIKNLSAGGKISGTTAESHATLERAMTAMNLSLQARAEELSPEQFIDLFRRVN